MKIITLIIAASVAVGGTGCDRLRHKETPAPIETPLPELDASVLGSVVRVEMGGKFRGAGIAVEPKYVITALANLDEYEYHRRIAAIGSDHIPGKVVAVDKRRGMALIKTERPLARFATLAKELPTERSPAVVVAYADLQSEPPMVELRLLRASFDQTHFSRETTGDMELQDAMLVSSPQAGDVRRRGAAAFDPATGKLAGMIVGAMLERPQSSSPFIAVTAATIRSFLAENGVTAH
ncbi:MAG TPA: hypothetical protein VL500_04000 [Candidatus Eisenbacteria bacterium]|nr:hypothetical protein [Candidatus Eisenbacteria bacterium]